MATYRSEERILSLDKIEEKRKREEEAQRAYDFKQSRGISVPKMRIEGVTHVFDDGTLRSEKLKKEQEEQSAHDFADGTRLNLKRIGWS